MREKVTLFLPPRFSVSQNSIEDFVKLGVLTRDEFSTYADGASEYQRISSEAKELCRSIVRRAGQNIADVRRSVDSLISEQTTLFAETAVVKAFNDLKDGIDNFIRKIEARKQRKLEELDHNLQKALAQLEAEKSAKLRAISETIPALDDGFNPEDLKSARVSSILHHYEQKKEEEMRRCARECEGVTVELAATRQDFVAAAQASKTHLEGSVKQAEAFLNHRVKAIRENGEKEIAFLRGERDRQLQEAQQRADAQLNDADVELLRSLFPDDSVEMACRAMRPMPDHFSIHTSISHAHPLSEHIRFYSEKVKIL
eukprot:GCRY01004540.1.p1 GENE.GCRY01004540.1~~GCRY01004540.1.p1  ORF type:complete len:314 (-),score=99.04 GCRY01004540.1:14-955(-)